eukprot:5539437-Amphidinium_carterae.1
MPSATTVDRPQRHIIQRLGVAEASVACLDSLPWLRECQSDSAARSAPALRAFYHVEHSGCTALSGSAKVGSSYMGGQTEGRDKARMEAAKDSCKCHSKANEDSPISKQTRILHG